MTFDTICEVLMSEQMNTLSTASMPYKYNSIAHSLDTAHELISRRYMHPWWRIQKFLNVGSERVLKKEISKFKLFVSNVIAKRRLLITRSHVNSHDQSTHHLVLLCT